LRSTETGGLLLVPENPPVGLKIDKDNGLLHFKADKAFFLSGRLKYDKEYKVILGFRI